MRLTERDKAILAAVSRYRLLSTSLILSLVPGSRQNITRRLQRLYHAGFLDRPRAQLALRYSGELSEIVYCPSRKCDAGRGRKSTTPLFLAHALMVSEVLIRIESDCRTQGAKFIAENEILSSASEEPSMRRLQWRIVVKSTKANESIGVIPDGAFSIEHSFRGIVRRRYFFLEADRGTMPIYRKSLRLSSIRRKAIAYGRSRKGRVLKDRFGITGFQVLFITHSKERLARMKEVCRDATGGAETSPFFFITIDEFRALAHPLDLIYPQMAE